MDDVEFRRDLYRGTAAFYDRFRPGYPHGLIDDLVRRTGLGGGSRVLDLACGTGQISFALHGRVGEIWAVDQEPDMIAVVKEKAQALGVANMRILACAAEGLTAPGESFDLVAIGNAFHRLPREDVAARVFQWLRPGGRLALLWGGTPWEGDAPWQQAWSAVQQRWMARAKGERRIPADYERTRRDRPDAVILAEAGFTMVGNYPFPIEHEWTADQLVGFAYSTSVLSREALGDHVAAFEEDLRRELAASAPDGRLRQTLRFSYDLARRG